MTSFFLLLFQLVCACMLVVVARKFVAMSMFSSAGECHLQNRVAMLFSDAGFAYSSEQIFCIISMGAVVSMLCGAVISIVMAIIAPCVAGICTWLYLTHRIQQKRKSSQSINDEICYFIARSLRAGHSLDRCMKSAHEQFDQSVFLKNIRQQTSLGVSLAVAVQRAEAHHNATKMLCATILLAQEMGGNSARIFERIGDCFHQTYELMADTSSSLSQVRMSTYVISALPVVMLGLSTMMGSNTIAFLFTQPVGWACLVFGGILEALGVMWMKKLVAKGVGIWTS